MGAPMGTRLVRREGRAASAMPGPADERARKPGSTKGEGRHRTKPFVPEVGPGATDCAVEQLAQETETSLILRRPRAAVTPRAITCNKSVVVRIIPPGEVVRGRDPGRR